MPVTISVFNNKGGVGKTTYMYHVAHLLARSGKRVLLVDCDTQCNLTAYCMWDADVERSWRDDGNSVYRGIEPVFRGIGDVRSRAPSKVHAAIGELFIIPGDIRLSDFEDLLGDTWSAARGGSEPALRAQSAIYRYVRGVAEKCEADLVMVDLGPNLGPLNRSVLAGSDYFITPVAPDLFSLQGTENLGGKLVAWRREWDQCKAAWSGSGFDLPAARPSYMGYVLQRHNIRSNAEGMTKGWQIYGKKIGKAVERNIVAKLEPLAQVVKWVDDDYKLGQIPNLHSLIPYSLDAKKPVFYCTSADGLRGAHIATAAGADKHFEDVVNAILGVLES